MNSPQKLGVLTSTLRLHLARFVILYKIAKGLPNFHIHFNDTCQIYVNLDLDYVLKYSLEVPLTYHLLKADYIVRLSRKAAVEKREEDAEDSDLINWQFNSPSLELNKLLTGAAKPKHTLLPEKSVPIDCFNLFIPMFFFGGGVIFAKYKNTKAEMAKEEKDGKMRLVLVVLRSKHFLGSVIWYCICKQLTLCNFTKTRLMLIPVE